MIVYVCVRLRKLVYVCVWLRMCVDVSSCLCVFAYACLC